MLLHPSKALPTNLRRAAILPIDLSHIAQLEKLPPHHKDPFDRMIIAQAMVEEFTIISIDGVFTDYAVPVIW